MSEIVIMAANYNQLLMGDKRRDNKDDSRKRSGLLSVRTVSHHLPHAHGGEKIRLTPCMSLPVASSSAPSTCLGPISSVANPWDCPATALNAYKEINLPNSNADAVEAH